MCTDSTYRRNLPANNASSDNQTDGQCTCDCRLVNKLIQAEQTAHLKVEHFSQAHTAKLGEHT